MHLALLERDSVSFLNGEGVRERLRLRRLAAVFLCSNSIDVYITKCTICIMDENALLENFLAYLD